jgi:hypothetical protein
MEPPLCRTCGKNHWSRLCEAVTPAVTSPVTPRVTQTIADLVAENGALRAEVKMLKAELAKAHKPPMTGAERVRKHRDRKASRPA